MTKARKANQYTAEFEWWIHPGPRECFTQTGNNKAINIVKKLSDIGSCSWDVRCLEAWARWESNALFRAVSREMLRAFLSFLLLFPFEQLENQQHIILALLAVTVSIIWDCCCVPPHTFCFFLTFVCLFVFRQADFVNCDVLKIADVKEDLSPQGRLFSFKLRVRDFNKP